MEGLISFLLFAALFYFMMRYGCGAHMMHGHGGHGKHSVDEARGTVKGKSVDPVCGMEVEPDEGYAKMHNGQEYRFCSSGCLSNFDRDPERYLKNEWKKEDDEGGLQ
ncbi:MAG: YHS domain-containing protein [Gammaproteobacteria bacterium]|nr:YHS domain-containing protein [Gammaproteobacteria bacterium]